MDGWMFASSVNLVDKGIRPRRSRPAVSSEDSFRNLLFIAGDTNEDFMKVYRSDLHTLSVHLPSQISAAPQEPSVSQTEDVQETPRRCKH